MSNKMAVAVLVEIPDGYELAEKEMREPRAGELYLSSCGEAVRAVEDWKCSGKRAILRESWEWPSWLKANYICMGADGDWHTSIEMPAMTGTGWVVCHSVCLSGHNFNFTPPPCTDWRESVRPNPDLWDK